MKRIFLVLYCFYLCSYAGCSTSNEEKVKIIFDTDLGPDYDDVGALAFLHAMADSGRAEILATLSSNRHELVAPSIEVINTYFGRPDLEIGAPIYCRSKHGIGTALGRLDCFQVSS